MYVCMYKTRARWLLLVKIYGNHSRKLFIRIIINSEMKIVEFPLSLFYSSLLSISLCNMFITKFFVMLFVYGIRHILGAISISHMFLEFKHPVVLLSLINNC
jgi:hypothetical protein